MTVINRPVKKYVLWGFLAVALLALVRVLTDKGMRTHFITGASLTQGALISAIALGVILTYRGSGVVNFATGATAMYTSYVYATLRSDGDLFLPPLPNPFALIEGVVHKLSSGSTLDLPDWPTRISFGPNMQLAPALLVSLVFCVLLGLALHVLVFRPLRHAPPLAKVVASVGLLLFFQAIIVRRFGTTTKATTLTRGTPKQYKLPLDVRMNSQQLLVTLIVLVFTAALWAVFRYSRLGLATRAAAENEKGAVLLGYSPEFLAGANWVLSTVISGLLGILVAGTQKSVDPATITLLILPALSCALVGGLTSFAVTTAAAFGLAMTQALIPYLGASRSWFPKAGGQAMPGVAQLVPFVVIVLVLALRGDSLPTRGAISAGRLPFAPSPSRLSTRVLGPGLAIACAITLLFLATPNGRLAIFNSLGGIVISLSFVVITGFVGQISLAQMMLAGISGFTLSKLTAASGIHWGSVTLIPKLPFPFSPLVGAVFATIVGMLVALPAIRIRGVNLAIVTFAFAIAMNDFLFKNPGVSGGFKGAPVKAPKAIDPLRTVTFSRGKGANSWFGVFCLLVVVALCYAVANLRKSDTGKRLLATRSNERAAAAAGIDVARTKIIAFAIASAAAGIGGALVGYRFGKVDQPYFGDTQSLAFLAFAYLGGIASVSGAVAAGFLVPAGIVFTILQTVFKVPPEFTLILGGLGLIVSAVLNPEGIAGGVRLQLLARRKRAETAGAAAPLTGTLEGAS